MGLLRSDPGELVPYILRAAPEPDQDDQQGEEELQELCPFSWKERCGEQPAALPLAHSVPDRERKARPFCLPAVIGCKFGASGRSLPPVPDQQAGESSPEVDHALPGECAYLRKQPRAYPETVGWRRGTVQFKRQLKQL